MGVVDDNERRVADEPPEVLQIDGRGLVYEIHDRTIYVTASMRRAASMRNRDLPTPAAPVKRKKGRSPRAHSSTVRDFVLAPDEFVRV